MVYEQWLLSDLCVSSMECLPAIQEKCELNGPYLLQVRRLFTYMHVCITSYRLCITFIGLYMLQYHFKDTIL